MKRVVVIGGVAAGMKAAAKIRRCDGKAQITVLEKGKLVSYGACGMPYFVAGEIKSLEDMQKTPAGALRDSAFFKNVKNIDVRTEMLATDIDVIDKTVTARNLATGKDEIFLYDDLVVATGASPVRPKLPGIELENIFQFWYPGDAAAVQQLIGGGNIQRAVIIGAGLIGIEMAEAFSQQGIFTGIVEMKEQVFPAFLDEEVAASVAKHLKEKGVELHLGEKVKGFEGATAVTAVITDKGRIEADLVILSIGVRPNVDLAQKAGIVLGPTGAIAVDECLRTNVPHVYAGGDCAENVHRVSGKKVFSPMGSTANKHGRVIGENICGGEVWFRGVLNTVIVRTMGIQVGKSGLSEREAKEMGYDYLSVMVSGLDKPHYMPDAKMLHTKLIVEVPSRRVLGIQIFGPGDVAKRLDVVATVMNFQGTVDDLFDVDLSYAPPFNMPIDHAAVAANSAMNKLAGRLKGISSWDAREKLKNSATVFLDVRSQEECSQLCLADCENLKMIPLGQLRKRLQELNPEDEIIAFCKISLRGYEAETILEGEGFDNVKVLEGGLAAWPFHCYIPEEKKQRE